MRYQHKLDLLAANNQQIMPKPGSNSLLMWSKFTEIFVQIVQSGSKQNFSEINFRDYVFASSYVTNTQKKYNKHLTNTHQICFNNFNAKSTNLTMT